MPVDFKPSRSFVCNTTAKNIIARQKKLGMKNTHVAQLAGLSTGVYTKIINESRDIHLYSLYKISIALKTTPNKLMGFDLKSDDKIDKMRDLIERLDKVAWS